MIDRAVPPAPQSKPRVLYITHRVPYPPDKGDRIRNYHVLGELAKVASVWLVALADEPVSPEQKTALELHCERVELVPLPGKSRWVRAGLSLLCGRSLSEGLFTEPALDAVLRRWMQETAFAATLVSASSLTGYQRRQGLERIPAHVDLMDIDSQKWYDFAEATRGPKSWVYRLEGHRVRKLEIDIANWAKTITLVSHAETVMYNGFTHPGAAITATNGVDLDYFRPRPDVKKSLACAFVGAMDYFPNVDAAMWFAHEIFPQIRQQHPEAEFWVIGRKPTDEVLRLKALPGVQVMGTVPDVRPYVAAATLAVCPIRVARGLQNKVIEAMAMAMPTLAAPAAIAALHVTVGQQLLSPVSASDWVSAICELLLDVKRQRELGEHARQYVEAHHRWDRSLAPLVQRIVPDANRLA